MWLGAVFEVLCAAYELSTVVTDVILNYEYINRNWLEEYILSIVFLVVNGVVMGFVGLGIDALYPSRFTHRKWLNKLLGFSIGLLQMRVFVETVYSVVKSKGGKKTGDDNADAAGDSRVYTVGGDTVMERTGYDMNQRAKQLHHGLLYATFIQVIVRDIPLFVLQANATIHYRKWKFIDIFTVISTFVTLTRGTAAYVAKEDRGGMQFLAFVFLVGQFVFRLGAILLVAMTKGLAIVAYGFALTLFAILWTAKLRLAHPSPRYVDQLPRAIVFFPFFTLFIVDGSNLTASYGSTVAALQSKNLLQLHLWRCVENITGIVMAICLPRYTDFGVSSDSTVVTIGVICAGVYVVTGLVFYNAVNCCNTSDPNRNAATVSNNEADTPIEAPYYL
ncbi:hypothetical protein KRP22_010705 [Phytophthora ramorum]|nr:hypothetical protein KRP22_5423 [Phytophthora ramorum]